MDKFINNTHLMFGKGDGGEWKTMPNGARVFIPDGMSIEDAINEHFEKVNEFRKQSKKN